MRLTARDPGRYLPAARRCQRVAFNIFLCFFLRMRLRRFLIKDPMSQGTLADLVILCHVTDGGRVVQSSPSSPTDGVSSGRLNRNRAPPPSAWYTFTPPPSSWATWATMARPSPDPGRLRALGAR
jgi:hypothetical protein